MAIRRLICWYDIDTNVLVGEVDATPIPVDALQTLFELPPEPSNSWQSCLIGQEQAGALSEWIDIAFAFDEFIYQLDSCSFAKATS